MLVNWRVNLPTALVKVMYKVQSCKGESKYNSILEFALDTILLYIY